MIRTLVALGVFTATLFAQRSVPPEFANHHVYAIVPLVGSGTDADPRRPMLVPPPPQPNQLQTQGSDPPDLLGYQMQISDDGKFALVDFAFRSPVAFHNFLAQAASSGMATSPQGVTVTAPTLQPIASDGSNLKALTANVAALKTAFESSIAGLKLFERGKASEAEILTAFRALKANFAFSSSVGAAQ